MACLAPTASVVASGAKRERPASPRSAGAAAKATADAVVSKRARAVKGWVVKHLACTRAVLREHTSDEVFEELDSALAVLFSVLYEHVVEHRVTVVLCDCYAPECTCSKLTLDFNATRVVVSIDDNHGETRVCTMPFGLHVDYALRRALNSIGLESFDE